MSKRLQVILPDAEYKELQKTAKRRKCSVAGLVRYSLREALRAAPLRSSEERISSVLRFAAAGGPTGDIEEILAEIERGRMSS